MARNSLKNVLKLIDEVKEELPPEKEFLNDLKRSIEISDEKNRRPASQSYKPSSMNCLRQMYYIVTGKPEEKELSNYCGIGICNSGTDIHQRIQQAVLDMQKNGINCIYVNVADYVEARGCALDYLEIVERPNFKKGKFETKLFHKKLNMSFLCDGIIRYKDRYYILEIKSEGSNKFFNRNDVNPDHYNQGTAYSVALDIDNVIFVYINRDIFDMKSFMFTPTDEMKQNFVGRITECDNYVKNLKVPPKPIDVPRKTCEYCHYKTECRKDG